MKNYEIENERIGIFPETKPIQYMSKVNLDALIPREDFAAQSQNENKQQRFKSLNLSHLLPQGETNYASIYHLLKKPDFQRETNEWDKKRIGDLIEAFIERSFVPSVILWENEQNRNIYVIDGAHRISAILAYINDDYGDREISNKFYSYKIAQAELDLANETRQYINNRVGSFTDVMTENGYKADGIKALEFDVQIITGDVKKAEDSFFKINQQGVILSPTEKALCKSRDFPSCIATRAIIKGGMGTQYWKNFKAENQQSIKDIALQLNEILFFPPYNEASPTIVNHNLGGQIMTATPMIFDLTKIIKKTYFANKEQEDKTDGASTLQYLIYIRKIVWKIFAQQVGSLGLYPTVYFYNSSGKYIQSAFLGMTQLLIEVGRNSQKETEFLIAFTKVRKQFEDFLIKYKVFVTQINRKYGSKDKSTAQMKGFFLNLINLIEDTNNSEANILLKLKAKYDFLNEYESDFEKPKKSSFNADTRIFVSNKEELESSRCCKICGGYLHPNSQSPDHKQDIKYGGSSDPENLQWTHWYCNMSKDRLIKDGFYINN